MRLPEERLTCSCGGSHRLELDAVVIENGALKALASYLRQHSLDKNPLLISDDNTYEASARQAAETLRAEGITPQEHVFVRAGELVPDERALGELMLTLRNRPSVLVSVGAGTITDITRYTASISGLPFVAVACASSMDGYASSVAPLICAGMKETLPSVSPQAIFGDPDVLAAAPARMLQAGFGDLLGKLTAKADWLLGHAWIGESHCPYEQDFVDAAVMTYLTRAEECRPGNPAYAASLLEGLIISGIGIAMAGDSRPASGSEHHFAHYWEIRALKDGRSIPLHGQKVGVATVLIARLYELMQQRAAESGDARLRDVFQKLGAAIPRSDYCRSLLGKAGAPATYSDLGIPKDWVIDAFREAMHIRERFTILRLAEQQGWLADATDRIISEL